MANLSVKLDEATRLRLQEAAGFLGQTPHALMVKAIYSELDRVEAEGAFVARAIAARSRVIEGGSVFNGPSFASYLKHRVRGQVATRPEAQPMIDTLGKVG